MRNKLLHSLNDLFCLIFLLLLLFSVKPELIYHFQQLGFSTSYTFFSEYSSYPGGIAEYISLFLFQFYSKAFWGALISTIVLSVILTIAGVIVEKGNNLINGTLRFIPAVFLGILFTNYALHPVFQIMVLMLFIFFFLFKLICDGKLQVAAQLVLNVLLFSLAYYITGGFALLILSVSSIIYLIFSKNKSWLFSAGLIVVLFVILPYLAQSVFFINSKDAYFKLVPYFSKFKPGFLLYGALFSLPLIVLVKQLISKYSLAKVNEKNEFLKSDKFQALQVVFMILVFVIGAFLNLNSFQKHKLKVDYLAHNRKWDELLKLVEKEPSDDRLIQFQTTRALYHTGVLTEKLFNYPQIWGVDGLFLTRHFADEILLPTTELFFDLGFNNEAIHYGNEAISQNENSPLIIEQLILANIVAKKYSAANIYINNLKTFPVFKKKAFQYEQYINGVSFPELDKLVNEKRELMPVNDFMVDRMLPQSDMLNLLIDKPQNKMAYEYFMSCLLLNNDLASFIKYYSMGKRFNYNKVPKIFQEALILYSYGLSQQGKSLGNLRYDKEIVDQFNEYISVMQKNDGDQELAQPELKKKFGNTYWYYIHYNSPVTTNKKIVTE
jgi:hypothetical protein